jgi:HD-like signal output (HDOD) protein
MNDVAQLLEQVEHLPTLPEVPLRVLQLMDDPETSLGDVAIEIALDPVLAGRVLKLANSPMFAGRGGADTLASAVVRVGLREVRALVVTVGVIQAFNSPTRILSLREAWRHAIGSAVLARKLASDVGVREADRAYLAALLHDVGALVLALCFEDRFEQAILNARKLDLPGCEALESEFKVAIPALSARILERWNFPAPIIEAVEYQRMPEQAPEQQVLAELLLASDRICRHAGLGIEYPGDSRREWLLEVPPKLLERAARGGEVTDYLAGLTTALDMLGQILGVLFPDDEPAHTTLLS